MNELFSKLNNENNVRIDMEQTKVKQLMYFNEIRMKIVFAIEFSP